jgi:hypothetical protein
MSFTGIKTWRGILRFGVHFWGCGVAACTACLQCCQRAAENGFAADDGSVSGDGRSSRCCTVGELLQDCDSVSVMTVQEKCDEKGLGAASGHRNVRCWQFGRALLALFEKWLARVVPSPKVVQPALGVSLFASELVVQNDNRPVASYVKRDSSYQLKTSMIAKPGKATRNGRFRKARREPKPKH